MELVVLVDLLVAAVPQAQRVLAELQALAAPQAQQELAVPLDQVDLVVLQVHQAKMVILVVQLLNLTMFPLQIIIIPVAATLN
jgi:hypothetical protein